MQRISRGEIEAKPVVRGHRRTGSAQTELMSVNGARSAIARSFSIGLPVYASLKLGGVQTGLVILTALVSDLMSLDEKPNVSKLGSPKKLLNTRRWTMAAILLQSVCNSTGLTSRTNLVDNFTGLLALSLCVFALPPPFPAYSSKKEHITSPAEPPPSSGKSILTTLKEMPASSSTVIPDSKVSSLIYSPEEINLTLVAGTLTGLVTIVFVLFSLIPSAGAISFSSLGGMLLAICMIALSLTFARPQSLLESRGVGLLIGSLFSLLLSTVFEATPPIFSAYQVVVIVLCSLATIKDTHTSYSSSHHTHGHGHGHSHHDHHKQHTDHHDDLSRISRFLLSYSQQWPLLHSILSEKDSRRIFYFMMYVLRLPS